MDPERIGEVIGTGGKIINGIIKETGVSIDISDEGLVSICSTDGEQMERARKMIDDILHEFKPGEEFTGKVMRIMDFGVIVSLPGGNDGMVHVSEMAPYRVGQPGDILNMGDEVSVRVKEASEDRISLTMKGIEQNQKYWEGERGKQEGGGFSARGGSAFGGGDRGGRGGRPRENDNRRHRPDDRRPRR